MNQLRTYVSIRICSALTEHAALLETPFCNGHAGHTIAQPLAYVHQQQQAFRNTVQQQQTQEKYLCSRYTEQNMTRLQYTPSKPAAKIGADPLAELHWVPRLELVGCWGWLSLANHDLPSILQRSLLQFQQSLPRLLVHSPVCSCKAFNLIISL